MIPLIFLIMLAPHHVASPVPPPVIASPNVVQATTVAPAPVGTANGPKGAPTPPEVPVTEPLAPVPPSPTQPTAPPRDNPGGPERVVTGTPVTTMPAGQPGLTEVDPLECVVTTTGPDPATFSPGEAVGGSCAAIAAEYPGDTVTAEALPVGTP
jgi:hypothetical protein